MTLNLRRALLAVSGALVVGGAVAAQSLTTQSGPTLQIQSAGYAAHGPLSDADSQSLLSALSAAQVGDAARIRSAMQSISDPLARKIALWALVDTNTDGMSYAELDGARRDLAAWPGAAKREAATEKVLEGGGLSPQGVIAWFAGADPSTAQGAVALASAYQSTGHADQAAAVIRHIWRTQAFDADVQSQMLARFGSVLIADDHAVREDMLLYGAQGPAAHDMLVLLSPDQQALAQARMALRAGSSDARGLINALPASLQSNPGLAYEQVFSLARAGHSDDALAMMPSLPSVLPEGEPQNRMWKLRSALILAALKAGDSHGAYAAAANSGLTVGEPAADAEFYAGWLALSRLKDPKLADIHFAKLQSIGTSPLTQSRALYWRGRAAEAEGDTMNAQLFYADAGRYPTTFYGQLAAAKAGQTTLTIGKDPDVTIADHTRFDDRETIRAARMLADIGAKDTFKVFVMGLAETLPNTAEAALLVDMVRGAGDQDLSMKVVRKAAQHGMILPERGYPLHTPPQVAGAPESAFVLGIVRQESGFDPHARSGAGAMGMMQLMPGTASILARKLGYSYSGERLYDTDYNMQLGSAYLGQLVDQFNGSYVMAAAAYNAGPGRPTEWTSFCGDPRTSSSDPADFIECIPFSQTRDYVMRVMETTEVYRARLAGGSAPLTLPTDLKRGGIGYGYGYTPGVAQLPPNAGKPVTADKDGLAANSLTPAS